MGAYSPVAPGCDAGERNIRLSGKRDSPDADHRSPAQKDRDRILYCSAFQRLGAVTQVAPSEQNHVLHNRLTHTLKVAQIGRRLAEKLLTKGPHELDYENHELANSLGGLDPDVVEAAGLAHDLGHPPFGHITEELLDEIITGKHTDISKSKVDDGFEGNAQSFRQVTKLAMRAYGPDSHNGFSLDLTKATLNALLKYPRPRATTGYAKKKFGFYATSESNEFHQARKAAPSKHTKTLEAEIMDWSDDIAYAVFDIDDFFRAGLIPLDRLLDEVRAHQDRVLLEGPVMMAFYENVFQRHVSFAETPANDIKPKLKKQFDAFCELLNFIVLSEPDVFFSLRKGYQGTDQQRVALRKLTGRLVERYIGSISLHAAAVGEKTLCPILVGEQHKNEVAILKELTWSYVIRNPELAGIQYGQKKIIKELFRVFADAINEGNWYLLPPYAQERCRTQYEEQKNNPALLLRLVADIISGLTEMQATAAYQRFTGQQVGTMLSKIF